MGYRTDVGRDRMDSKPDDLSNRMESDVDKIKTSVLTSQGRAESEPSNGFGKGGNGPEVMSKVPNLSVNRQLSPRAIPHNFTQLIDRSKVKDRSESLPNPSDQDQVPSSEHRVILLGPHTLPETLTSLEEVLAGHQRTKTSEDLEAQGHETLQGDNQNNTQL